MTRSFVSRTVLTAGVVAMAGALAASATAGVSGPCTATIAGSDVATRGTGPTSKPIVVDKDASVPVVLRANGALQHVRITMEFAGYSWVVRDKDVKTSVYRDTVPVKDYATYGVGLYKVKGVGTGPGLRCSGAALVKVDGNPVTTVAGGAALAAALLGLAGIAAGVLGGRKGIRPARTALSALAGLLLGAGAVVLLQQAAVLYPTMLVAGLGLVLGLAVGIVAPWLGHVLAHRTSPMRPATPLGGHTTPPSV